MGALIQHTEFEVPLGEGHVIGDILRRYAINGCGTWQIIAYKLNSSAPNFGNSNGSLSSYLELRHGVLVYSGEVNSLSREVPHIVNFEWNGTAYVWNELEIRGLDPVHGPTVTACIRYAKRHFSAEQNREVLRQMGVDDTATFFSVPSSHSKVSVFKFSVQPIDDLHETLSIEADDGVVKSAVKSVVESFTGLGI